MSCELNPRLRAAIEYLGYGWSAIALCSHNHEHMPKAHTALCQSPGKVPMGKWRQRQTQRATQQELEREWNQWPIANVGVVMGRISNLVGIDVDGLIGAERLQEMSCNDLPSTLHFNTGRDDSFRYLYRLPDDCPAPLIPIRDDNGRVCLTIMGDGSQTVMPPSIHYTGSYYAWTAGSQPGERQLADAPDWLVAILRQHYAVKKQSKPKTIIATSSAATILQGGRNNTLATFAGAIRRHGATEEEIYVLIRKLNERCEPPCHDAELRTIANSIASYAPGDPLCGRTQSANREPEPTIIDLAALEMRPIQWIWPGWIPQGKLVNVAGDGGTGKSTAILDIVARITRGVAMPDGSTGTTYQRPGNCIVISDEDDPSDTIKPRLLAAGADLQRVVTIDEIITTASKNNKTSSTTTATTTKRPIAFPDDAEAVADLVRRFNARLLVIDPVTSFFGKGFKSNEDIDVRNVLKPFKHLAHECGCTVIYVLHLNKGNPSGKAIYRSSGSVAFYAMARLQIMFGHHPDNDNQAVMAVAKSNIGKKPAAHGYEVKETEIEHGIKITYVEWLGPSADINANDIASAPIETREERSKADECMEFLQTYLSDGPKTKASIRYEVKKLKLNFNEMLLHRARLGAGIKFLKNQSVRYEQYWFLPEHEYIAQQYCGLPASAPVTIEEEDADDVEDEANGDDDHGSQEATEENNTPQEDDPGTDIPETQ